MKTPLAYSKLVEEIDAATKSGKLGNPVRYDEAARLPYLAACIQEAMRLHPSVGQALPRFVPRGGREICGVFFPEGMRVGVNAAIAQRDKAVFGDDADEFNPDRWLGDEASNRKKYMLHVCSARLSFAT